MTRILKGEQSKHKIIRCAARLFWQKGYNATGINEILMETDLPKGSFYFHFASKKELAIQVAAYYDQKINDWIAKTAEGRKWDDFITTVVNDIIDGAENKRNYGCPLAVLGLEIAFSEPEVAKHYAESMQKTIGIFESVFRFSGIPEAHSEVIAQRAFAVYEGHLLLYRISKDVEMLRRMLRDLLAVYEAMRMEINAVHGV